MIKKSSLIIGVVVALAIGFLGGFYVEKNHINGAGLVTVVNQAAGKPADVDFNLFWQVWNRLQAGYVDKSKLNAQEMVYGAIQGMLDSIGDPYTVFFKPKEAESFAQEIGGSFGGVGIELGMRDNSLTVIAPIKDTPAEKAGILAGDKIIGINGKPTDGMRVDEAVRIIRGPRGTSVKLSIVRESFKEPKDFTLSRETIKIPAVSWKMRDGNVAYLQVFIFNQNVDNEFKKAAHEIVQSGAKKIVLDLRNNPGGLLDSSVDLASYFINGDKTVVIERMADGTQTVYKTKQNGQLKDYPLIVLVNKGSASASEILAGALRDDRHVSIVGETSFGKGSVQEIQELAGKTSLKMTIAKWFTPNNYSINENGIKPDVEIMRSDDDILHDRDPQLDKALELIKGL